MPLLHALLSPFALCMRFVSFFFERLVRCVGCHVVGGFIFFLAVFFQDQTVITLFWAFGFALISASGIIRVPFNSLRDR